MMEKGEGREEEKKKGEREEKLFRHSYARVRLMRRGVFKNKRKPLRVVRIVTLRLARPMPTCLRPDSGTRAASVRLDT